MTNEVYANNMEVACKAASGKSTCAFPDVCFTPPQTPATPTGVPIPYPNTGFASDTTDGSTTVQISGQEVMLKNKSYFKKSTGDEAGSAPKKGMINGQITGKVYFTMWSMDVMIEGENVVRHLDLTTHNHGSTPNESIPFPYTDAIAMAVAGHPCQAMGKAVKEDCTGATDYSEKCCDARKCLMAPYSPKSCCAGSDGEQMTPHHLLPSNVFIPNDLRRTKLADPPEPETGYHDMKAPCVCVEGPSHHKGTEHGDVGTEYTAARNRWLKDAANKDKKITLAVGIALAAQSGAAKINHKPESQGCDEECLKKQLEDGHANMSTLKVKSTDPLPRSPQPRKMRMV
jgi:Toxin PAAR-like domain/GHH signature containing HNH/Endo VII superfamily nuclease toxin  2